MKTGTTIRKLVAGSFVGVFAIGLIIAMSTPATAGVYTLEDKNSIVTIDTEGSGQVSWLVDGVEQLFRQTFFYRVGSAGGESEITSLDLDFENAVDLNGSGDDNVLFVRYADPGGDFEIEIQYGLLGAASGSLQSDLTEQIAITNLSNAALDIHFFQYVDFDLGGDAGDDIGKFINDNTVRQRDTGPNVVEINETVITPDPDHRELSLYPSLINSLEDGSPTTLSDSPAEGIEIMGDIAWGFEWDFLLSSSGPNSVGSISKDKRIGPVPEPSSLIVWSLLGLCLGGFARWRKRTK